MSTDELIFQLLESSPPHSQEEMQQQQQQQQQQVTLTFDPSAATAASTSTSTSPTPAHLEVARDHVFRHAKELVREEEEEKNRHDLVFHIDNQELSFVKEYLLTYLFLESGDFAKTL